MADNFNISLFSSLPSKNNGLNQLVFFSIILIMVMYLFTDAMAATNVLYFTPAAETDADKVFAEAFELKKMGKMNEALEKYESAIISKRFLLSKDDGGLKKLLIDKYKKAAAAEGGIENYYKLGYLFDITGNLNESIKCYNKAIELASTDTIRSHITSLLSVVQHDAKFYEKLFEKSAMLPEPPPAEESSKRQNAQNGHGESEIAVKIKESKLADYNEAVEEIETKIAAAEKRLEEAQDSERKAKNDWSGRANFKRDWRDTPSSDPLVDQSNSYQNTYRRRYRQAKSAREEIEKEITALKEEKKTAEEELKLYEEELDSMQPPDFVPETDGKVEEPDNEKN